MHSDQLTRYLLGELPEDEMRRLNTLSVSDGALSERLRLVEDDLIEAFVRGRLRGDALARFRRFFLSTREHRERVKIAQGFLEELPMFESGRPGWWRKVRDYLKLSARRLLAGVALLLFAGCVWLVWDYFRFRQQLAQAEAERHARAQQNAETQQQINQNSAAHQQVEAQISEIRDRLNQVAPAVVKPPPPEAKSAPTEVQLAAFTLRPAARGAQPVAELVVSLNAQHVMLQLELGRDERAAYRAALLSQGDGQRLWTSGTLRARTKDAGKVVEVKIPAKFFHTQAYTLRVTGANAAGADEETLDYPFKVVRR